MTWLHANHTYICPGVKGESPLFVVSVPGSLAWLPCVQTGRHRQAGSAMN